MDKSARTLTGDLGVLQRESGMAMATISSLRAEELTKPSSCEGWTRAHVIAHLAQGADALADLARSAISGREAPEYESRENRDADIEATAALPAGELAGELARADARLLEAFRDLKRGVQLETVETLFSGRIDVFSLPALRTAEVIVHHNDLDTTWEWHEADPDATVDAIGICVHRLEVSGTGPGLHVVAREGEEWVVGDGSHRIEGYYETLLPFLARQQVDEGLRHEGELPQLPPW